MREPVWVLPDVVIAVHKTVLAEHGGLPGVRDRGLLDSALNRPRQRFVYDLEASVFDLAASYAYGISDSHPFVDGNKRMALSVSAIFLELNGYSLDAPEPETTIVFLQLASGELGERELSLWFKDSSKERI